MLLQDASWGQEALLSVSYPLCPFSEAFLAFLFLPSLVPGHRAFAPAASSAWNSSYFFFFFFEGGKS